MTFKDKNSHSLWGLINADLVMHHVNHHGTLWTLYYTMTIPGFRAAFLYRLAYYFKSKGNGWVHLSRFFWQLNICLHSCDLGPEAFFKGGLYMPHPIGIVIGRANIGSNVILLQNTTIGKHYNTPYVRSAYPEIGDNVTISAGAVILGALKIGDNAIIGANAVVLKNVPPNHRAVGVPARILPPKTPE